MIVFGAVLQVEMITVDSSDPQTSPDSQHLLGIGYAPLSSGYAQAWFCRPWTLQLVQAHACTVPVKHDFSIWHLRNLATLGPKIANVPGSKVKFFAHCCHDSVESLISTSDRIIDMHTEHAMNFPLIRRTNAHGSRAQLVNPCSMSDALSLSHHFFGAFTNPYTAFLNRSTVS